VRFVALNEVGGDPSRFGMSTSEFHARVLRRARRWPDAMLTTSTHDSMRSEDVRARLAVLSERIGAWSAHAEEWLAMVRDLGHDRVDGADVYLLLQTLAGAWPIERERTEAYMIKAAREAKLRTSWRQNDERYERELATLVESLYGSREFIGSLESFVGMIRRPGRIKSLAQVVLRLACPGVGDTYQGCELWELSLVDPDNRRPVDFGLRARCLDRLESMPLEEVWTTIDDPDDPGLSKLWVTGELLRLCREAPEVFGGTGAYTPIRINGAGADHALAFARGDPPRFVGIVPTRTSRPIEEASLEIPGAGAGRRWLNICTGVPAASGQADAAGLLADTPIALLVSEELGHAV